MNWMNIKRYIIVLSVFMIALYISTELTFDDFSAFALSLSLTLTVVTIFLWNRLAKKFNL